MTNEVTEASDDKLKRLAARAWDMGLHKPFETVKSDALASQEPAVAYRHHEQAAVAKLALVDDKQAKHEAKNEALETQKAIALVNIDALIARADGSQKENLEKLKRKIEGAKSLEALATLANAAQSEGLTDGADILETSQQKAWNAIEKTSHEIKDVMYGQMNKDQRDRDDAYDREIEEAKRKGDLALAAKLEKERNEWRGDLSNEWKTHGTEGQKEAARKAEPLIEKQREQTKNTERWSSPETSAITNNKSTALAPGVEQASKQLSSANVSVASADASNAALPGQSTKSTAMTPMSC